MNARPYIFGCLCLVGATGTAAASDIDPIGSLLSLGGATASSAFESPAPRGGSGQGSRDSGDVMSPHAGSVSPRTRTAPVPTPSGTNADDMVRDGAAPMRSPTPSWQSLLPGSMF